MTPRSDDYIKNMIRRMLVAEGWERRTEPPDLMTEESVYWRDVRAADPVPCCDPLFVHAPKDWRNLGDAELRLVAPHKLNSPQVSDPTA